MESLWKHFFLFSCRQSTLVQIFVQRPGVFLIKPYQYQHETRSYNSRRRTKALRRKCAVCNSDWENCCIIYDNTHFDHEAIINSLSSNGSSHWSMSFCLFSLKYWLLHFFFFWCTFSFALIYFNYGHFNKGNKEHISKFIFGNGDCILVAVSDNQPLIQIRYGWIQMKNDL